MVNDLPTQERETINRLLIDVGSFEILSREGREGAQRTSDRMGDLGQVTGTPDNPFTGL